MFEKTFEVKNKKGSVIGRIYFFIDYKVKGFKNRRQFIREFIKNLKVNKVDYAGLNNKELEKILNKFIFFLNSQKSKIEYLPKQKYQRVKVFQIIKKSLVKCWNCFSVEKPLKIFIFPCFSNFVKTKMEGVCGFVPRQNIIYLFLHPKATHFEKRLKYTVAHEFYHAVSEKYSRKWNKTILGSLVYEGLANYFRMKAVGGKLTSGLIALSEKQCRKIWPKVQKILNSKNPKIWRALFLGNKKYPLGCGYSLGYQIVKSFFKKNPKIKWKEVIKYSPREILKKSGWE
jgi:uncharacterized protein YjaZ